MEPSCIKNSHDGRLCCFFFMILISLKNLGILKSYHWLVEFCLRWLRVQSVGADLTSIVKTSQTSLEFGRITWVLCVLFLLMAGSGRLSSADLAPLLTSMRCVGLSTAIYYQDSTGMFKFFIAALKLSLKRNRVFQLLRVPLTSSPYSLNPFGMMLPLPKRSVPCPLYLRFPEHGLYARYVSVR